MTVLHTPYNTLWINVLYSAAAPRASIVNRYIRVAIIIFCRLELIRYVVLGYVLLVVILR